MRTQEKPEKREPKISVEVPSAITYVEMLLCRRTSVEAAMPKQELFQKGETQRCQMLPATEAQTYINRKQAKAIDKKTYDAFLAKQKKAEDGAMGVGGEGWK